MKKQLLILITLLIASVSYSQTFTDNFITYNVTSATTVEVTDYDSANGGSILIIPASVSYNSTNYFVTSIKFLAFQNSTITSVDIPDSLIDIGVAAFSGSSLDTITFGNSVTNIGGSAFYNCSLSSVTIPDSVTSIGNYAFQNNSLTNLSIGNSVATIGTWAFTSNQLATITIPNSVTTIGDFAFQNNPLTLIISEAIIPPTLTTSTTSGMDTFATDRSAIDLIIPTGTTAAYVTDPGALWTGFNSTTEAGSLSVGDTFIENFITYEITSLTPDEVEAVDYDIAGGTVVSIPATVANSSISYNVVGIGNSAFYNNNLSAITLPNSLVYIEDDAFRLNQIASLTITPNTVTTIGERAFRSNQITSLVIPNGVTYVGSYAFAQNLLTNVDIADSVTTIEGFVFWQNNFTDLSNVVFPIGTTHIPDGCFYENPFTNVVIPDGITSIGDTAFEENQIATVTLPSSLISIGVEAFKDNQITSITIPNGVVSIGLDAFAINQLESLDIPNSVTSIGNNAFKDNVLTSVVLGNGLTSISELCFQNNLLSTISIPNSITSIEDGAFENNLLTTITIPANVINIEGNAFIGNPLTSVTSESITPPAINTGSEDSFATDRSTIDLIIPIGTTGPYVTDSGAQWTGFNSVTEAVLSVSDFDLASDIKIISTFDEIRIVTSSNLQLENYTIFDTSGARVLTGTESEISKSLLSGGLYILKLTFNKGTLTKKVIVN